MSTSDELEAIKQDYATSLEELTFNSRPIILNLTTIAQENIHAAQPISRAIEEHISKSPPEYKLPAMYLLDSICKNVGAPYTTYFGLNLFKTFTDVYTLTNDVIRKKLIVLFETWKNSAAQSASGQSLFQVEPMRKLENFLERAKVKLMESQMKNQQGTQLNMNKNSNNEFRNQDNNQPPLTQAALLQQVDKLIILTNQRLSLDSRDVDAQSQLMVVNQLKNILMTQAIPSNDLPLIQNQLTTFTRKEHDRLVERKRLQQAQNHQQTQIGQQNQTNTNVLAALLKSQPNFGTTGSQILQPQPVAPQSTSFLSNFNQPSNTNYNSNPYYSNQASSYSPAPPTVPSDTNLGGIDFAKLGSILQSVGNISTHANSNPNNNYGQNIGYDNNNANNNNNGYQNVNYNNPPGSGYTPSYNNGNTHIANELSQRDDLLSNRELQSLDATTSSIQTARPSLISFLYENLSKPCSTCGRRFPNTERGKRDRQRHMDWHFRVNKKLREDGRAQNRCWYLSQSDWLQFRQLDEEENDEDEEETGISGSNNNGNQQAGRNHHVSNNDNSDSNKPTNNGDSLIPSLQSSSIDAINKRKRKGKFIYNAAKERLKYIPVPDDKVLAKSKCPICQEIFENAWNDDEEDWVLKNAVLRVDERSGSNVIFHATCFAEDLMNGGDLIRKIVGNAAVTGTDTNTNNVNNNPVNSRQQAPSANAALTFDLASILAQTKTNVPAKRPLDNLGIDFLNTTSVKRERTE
ncbi:hypothetical protein NADFUDRAFT_82046 [Nadsonia fulvescens var. elongata DSM 6958]|uniref:CID domain-containing protein n=1 Tax=Nadsonia fulvescens var. elongata DSM 6958 TaxID=857566 RepID=A0A1E3PQA0_9ASCO|nr:hypothetical protein NADFUDRAFT_82046 [Nadsonia fulvescens var. elongata DSM 6958]